MTATAISVVILGLAHCMVGKKSDTKKKKKNEYKPGLLSNDIYVVGRSVYFLFPQHYDVLFSGEECTDAGVSDSLTAKDNRF